MLQVKIFQAFGKTGIDDLESGINNWLENKGVKVNRTEIAAAGGIGHGGESETYQTLIACVWYEVVE